MDLLRYFHTSPWRVFRSRDHGVNLLRFASHCLQVHRTRIWVAPGGALTCKKDNLFVEANLFDAEGYAINSYRSGTSGITSGWPVNRPELVY
jgi:hypothetical protein